MKIQRFEFNLFGVNTYVMFDVASKEAAIVDPGMTDQRECERIDSFIALNGLKVKYLINTHSHIDHLFGDEYVKRKYGVGVAASTDDLFLSSRIKEQSRMFGLRTDMPDEIKVDLPLHDGDVLKLGTEPIEIISVPGHSPGSVALYCPESKFVVTGDALFRLSIGRTDLPGGNHAQLLDSIMKKLLTLPPDTTVYPGHGPSTTVGNEWRHNPFLN